MGADSAGSDPLLGLLLDGKYRLDALLGRGGMGAVYRATQVALQRAVAVKVVRGEFVAEPSVLKRFEREALTAASLKHPHIAAVYDFGFAAEVGAYLVMELLEGRSLRAELRARSRLPGAEAVALMLQVCSAVHTAHGAGVIHRDLKPENIFLERSPGGATAKVLDFGIARLEEAATSAATRLTHTGVVMGTPHYMSPEQGRGETPDARSDVYALGCVLYEMLTGRPPFLADTAVAVLYQHAAKAPSPLRQQVADLAPALEAAVLRALAKRPEERFQTTSALSRALELGQAGAPAERPTTAREDVAPTERLAAGATGDEMTLRQAAAPAGGFVFGPFRLLADVDLLYREGAVVPLEPRAVQVLRYLIEHRDRVVPKAELLDEVWADVFTTDAVLKKAVSQARRALGDAAGKARYIETYHRRGYRFVAAVVVGGEAPAPQQPASGGGSGRPARANLPQAVTSFVGREAEVAELRRLLASTRLATLTGVGGIGKTRLALEVARAALEDFADGVWLVELAAVADPALAEPALASTLGVREEANRPLMASLTEWLRGKQLLLVLDNCEHLVRACAALAGALLRACPGLRVLATSREALAVAGEVVWPVGGLTVPGAGEAQRVEQLLESEAVRMFVERARLSNPRFALGEANVRAVAEVCRELEGIPLAIELAAARVRVLTLDQILARLDDRFRLLTAGSRNLLPRQQTLRATIDWSYDLLSGEERVLLRRLAVFAGGWPLEAAEAVCTGDGIELAAVLDLVARLVDKSLVAAPDIEREARYRILETVREYALERLEASGEAEALKRRHAEFFLTLAEEAEPQFKGTRAGEWLEQLEAEHDNLRAALRWLLEHDPGAGLRLATAVGRYWYTRGHYTEGRKWLTAALERSHGAPARVRGQALLTAGNLALRQGDPAARAHFEESARIARDAGDLRQIAGASQGLGVVALNQGDLRGARAYFEASLASSRKLGNVNLVGQSLNSLGEIARLEGDYAAARSLYERALASARQAANPELTSIALVNLGGIAYEEGDLRVARACYGEALAIDRDLGFTTGISYSLDGFAALAANRGAWTRAARLAGAAQVLRDVIGSELDPADRAFREHYLAEVQEQLGETALEAAVAEGRAMTLEQAVAYALEPEADRPSPRS